MRLLIFILLGIYSSAFVTGCSTDQEKQLQWKPNHPYARIVTGDEDPGENGPDDSTELSAVEGTMGDVKFSHFTHSSNGEKGYGIPCNVCHHNVAFGEEPEEGCSECHHPSGRKDPARFGPEDFMILAGDDQDFSKNHPAILSHFTHASEQGYKIGCESCHHTGDLIKCTECHGEVATLEDGKIVPKAKRAFHQQCKGCHEPLVLSRPDAHAPVTCKGCHVAVIPKGLTAILSLERAYHQSCVGCHERIFLNKRDTKAPWNGCDGCHEGTPSIQKEEAATKPIENASNIKEAAPEQPAQALAKHDAGTDEVAVQDSNQKNGAALIALSGSDKGKKTKIFKHHEHQDYADNCKSCHHEGMDEPSCIGVCHEAKDSKKIFHKQCIDCHKENGVDSKCSFCHV